MKLNILKTTILTAIICLTSCSVTSFNSTQQLTQQNQSYDVALWKGNTQTIWNKLQHVSSSNLMALQQSAHDPYESAWIQLALISKQNSNNTVKLSKALLTWRAHYPSHPANALIPDNATLNRLNSITSPHQIAVLLPQDGVYGSSGQAVREGFLNAYYANVPNGGKQNIKFYDTTQTQDVASLYQKAIVDGADFVIGPLVRENVQQLKNRGLFQKPILALNYTDIHFGLASPNFYEFGLLPEDEAAQIADRAYRFGRTKAIVIAPRTAWGKRLSMAFASQWQSLGGRIKDTWYYSPSQTDFSQEVTRLLSINHTERDQQTIENSTPTNSELRHDFDVVFLFSQPKEAQAIVPLLRTYNAKIPIYATSGVADKNNPANNAVLNNVIVCDIPWNLSKSIHNSTDTQSDRLYAVGQDAYLLTQSLNRLVLLPNFPLYGTTGALTLSPTHQIHRRLPCTTVHNETG